MHSEKKARIIWLGLQFLPQAHDVRIHGSRGGELVIPPDLFK
jgi:hypothetical protein